MSHENLAGTTSFPSTLTPLPSNGSEVSDGTHEHGAQSARILDVPFISGVERASSTMADASTDGQNSGVRNAENSPVGSIASAVVPTAAPVLSSIVDDEGDIVLTNVITAQPDEAIVTEGEDRQLFMIGRRPRSLSMNESPKHSQGSWADLPDDGDLGEVPEFYSLEPSVLGQIGLQPASPRIPAELKQKDIDPLERGPTVPHKNEPRDVLDQWSQVDEDRALLDRPSSTESDEVLRNLPWNDENRRLSIQLQNIALKKYWKESRQIIDEQANVVSSLQTRINELERLAFDALTLRQRSSSEPMRSEKPATMMPDVKPTISHENLNAPTCTLKGDAGVT
jgi:hypothetical protein